MINININKQYQQATGLTQRLTKISHLLLIGVIVAETFCMRKCVCLLFTSLSCMENSFLRSQLYITLQVASHCAGAHDDVTFCLKRRRNVLKTSRRQLDKHNCQNFEEVRSFEIPFLTNDYDFAMSPAWEQLVVVV